MTRQGTKKLIALSLACSMSVSLFPSVAAFATQSHVRVESHHDVEDTKRLSKLSVDGIDAPEAGEALDDSAVVTSAEGETWDIPVLWVGTDQQLATRADEGQTYLPALAFFLPKGYSVAQSDMAGGFAVQLSDSVVELFLGQDVVSVYEEASEITYILPMSLRYFFDGTRAASGLGDGMGASDFSEPQPLQGAQALQAALEQGPVADSAPAGPSPVTSSPSDVIGPTQPTPGDADADSGQEAPSLLMDIYCSQEAGSTLGKDDLDYLVDLVVNTIQPEAIALLAERYPDFDAIAYLESADTDISLVISYGSTSATEGQAAGENDTKSPILVVGRDGDTGDSTSYQYRINLDISGIVKESDDGRLVIDRTSPAIATLSHNAAEDLARVLAKDGIPASTTTDTALVDAALESSSDAPAPVTARANAKSRKVSVTVTNTAGNGTSEQVGVPIATMASAESGSASAGASDAASSDAASDEIDATSAQDLSTADAVSSVTSETDEVGASSVTSAVSAEDMTDATDVTSMTDETSATDAAGTMDAASSEDATSANEEVVADIEEPLDMDLSDTELDWDEPEDVPAIDDVTDGQESTPADDETAYQEDVYAEELEASLVEAPVDAFVETEDIPAASIDAEVTDDSSAQDVASAIEATETL